MVRVSIFSVSTTTTFFRLTYYLVCVIYDLSSYEAFDYLMPVIRDPHVALIVH
jgi:hypothetical protein